MSLKSIISGISLLLLSGAAGAEPGPDVANASVRYLDYVCNMSKRVEDGAFCAGFIAGATGGLITVHAQLVDLSKETVDGCVTSIAGETEGFRLRDTHENVFIFRVADTLERFRGTEYYDSPAASVIPSILAALFPCKGSIVPVPPHRILRDTLRRADDHIKLLEKERQIP